MLAQRFRIRNLEFCSFAIYIIIRSHMSKSVFLGQCTHRLIIVSRIKQVSCKLNIMTCSRERNPLPMQYQISAMQIISTFWMVAVTKPFDDIICLGFIRQELI
ncbi:hypothetical protein D3C80_1853680 [compost metagenome]